MKTNMCLELTDHRNPEKFESIYYNEVPNRYTEVYMDVTNVCNAVCRYCKTGSANRKGENVEVTPYYMTKAEFQRLHEHMLNHEIITPDCIYRIYNWYEPSLNPHLPEIFNYMDEAGIRLDMSTNASRLINFNKVKSCEKWYGILFSMPGFSQESYDRMHGFDFEKIKDNIRATMKAIRERSFNGYAMINYHLYQFNLGEVRAAKEFADELGIGLHTIFAYFNGGSGKGSYLAGTLEPEVMREASRDLIFYHIDELIANKEKYFKEFQEAESITLSERCNVIPGRGSNDEDRIKSIFDVTSYQEIRDIYEERFKKAQQNPQFGNNWVWAHSYRISQNHLFGFEDNKLI